MISTAAVIGGSILAGFAVGHLGHEAAHYVVARAFGRNPELVIGLPLAVRYDVLPLSTGSRLVAVAPALVGVLVTGVAVATYSAAPSLLPVWVGAIAALCMLSPADRDIALGRLARLS